MNYVIRKQQHDVALSWFRVYCMFGRTIKMAELSGSVAIFDCSSDSTYSKSFRLCLVHLGKYPFWAVGVCLADRSVVLGALGWGMVALPWGLLVGSRGVFWLGDSRGQVHHPVLETSLLGISCSVFFLPLFI